MKKKRTQKPKKIRSKPYRPRKVVTPKNLPFNLNHPDLAGMTEFAFECKGKKYYRMVHEFRMPTGRYKFFDAYLLEHQLRMTPEMFNQYLDRIDSILNGRGGTIKLSDIAVTVYNMRTHANLLFVPDTIKKLASVTYFDDTEDLRDYDPEYGQKKIAEWMTDETYAFFLTRPITELLNLGDTSLASLLTYMNWAETTLKELTSAPWPPSSENSSGTETSK